MDLKKTSHYLRTTCADHESKQYIHSVPLLTRKRYYTTDSARRVCRLADSEVSSSADRYTRVTDTWPTPSRRVMTCRVCYALSVTNIFCIISHACTIPVLHNDFIRTSPPSSRKRKVFCLSIIHLITTILQ